MSDFRFEDLTIWKDSLNIGNQLFELAEKAENKRKYRFAEQLNGAALGISNNIAEGSGSFSSKDFANYLMIARKSLYECVNILHIYEARNIISAETRRTIQLDLVKLSRGIYSFRKNLLKD